MSKPQFLLRLNQFFIIFALGFLSGLPASMFGTTLQAWFTKTGSSIFFVSSLSLLNLPFLIRFIWGPLVDKYFFKYLGRRKTWLIAIQVLLLIAIEAMAFGRPQHGSYFLLTMAFLLSFLSSIQDLVIDAHRIEFLPKALFGFGAVIAIYAYRIALLISGGLALVFAEHWGFSLTYSFLGLFFLFGILLVIYSPEPTVAQLNEPALTGPYKDFLQQPGLLWIMGLLLSTKFGEVFVSNSSPIIIPFMMRGLGLSLSHIAYINKIFGLLAQLAGSGIAAFFIWRFSLLHLLLAFGGLQVVSNLMFVVLSLYPMSSVLLWTTVGFENLATGLCSTTMVAFLMHIVNPAHTATHFSLWIMIAIIPKLIAGPVGGYISQHYGWTAIFEVSSLLSACFVVFWVGIKQYQSLKAPGEIVSKVVSSAE